MDYFRGDRPWAQLVRIVQRLGPYTHTGRAIADDDELARRRDEANGGKPGARPGRPNLRSWERFDELTATITDVGNLIRTTLVQVNTQKGQPAPKFKPTKRPQTADDRRERMRDLETVSDIVSMVRPDLDQEA